jgi:hypothetical protein
MDKQEIYKKSLKEACQMMQDHEGLEPRSALKQAASDNGIPYGDRMTEFVLWAEETLFQIYKVVS